ncbi:hypothetical protein KDK77_02090 [bacterium]|nr:hypothetical protein [bacterium]
MGIFIFLAGLIGVAATYLIPIISRDTIRFIEMAYALSCKDWGLFLAEDFHPLHSVFIYGWYCITHNFVDAARFASISLWMAGFVPLFYIARFLFGVRTARITLALWMLHPYAVRFAADGLSEPCYISFLIAALWAGFLAMIGKRLVLLSFSAGILAAGAYLTRPEGIGVMIILGLFRLFYPNSSVKPLRRIVLCAVLAGGFMLAAFPYMVLLHQQTGEWCITKKKPVSSFFPNWIQHNFSANVPDGVEALEPASKLVSEDDALLPDGVRCAGLPKGNISNVKKFIIMNSEFIRTFHPLLFVFFLIWLIFGARTFTSNQRLLVLMIGGLFVLYYYILCKLTLTYYISKRHLLPIALLLMPFGARGLEIFCTWRRLNFIYGKTKRVFKPFLPVLLICLLVLGLKTFKPTRKEKMYIKDIAQWLAVNTNTSAVFAVDDARIPFYGKLNYTVLPKHYLSEDEIERFLGDTGAQYVLIGKENKKTFYPDIEKRPSIKVKYIFRDTDNTTGAVVYLLYEYTDSP